MSVRQSPEETGEYRCDKCSNVSDFIGHDAHGYPGDACECGKDVCECEVELVQPFHVHDDGDIDYDAHRGGGVGANIDAYSKIVCGKCGHVIWEETPAVSESEEPGFDHRWEPI